MKTEPDVLPLLRVIENARLRMLPLKDFALIEVCLEEMQNIIKAKDAYDQAVSYAHTARVLDLIFPKETLR